MCVRVVSQVSSTKTLHKPIDTNTMAVYDNQTKMYLNNEFYDKVFVEYDPDTETHYIRRVSDGHYLSAHEDQKHVFWTEPNTNIWTWEQMTLSTLGETPHILMTAHGTLLYIDDEDRLWQGYPLSTQEEDYSGYARLRHDFEMDYSVDCKPAAWALREPSHDDELKEEEEEVSVVPKKPKRELTAKQMGLNLFMKAKKDSVRSDNPEGSWGDHKKILGSMWKDLSTDQQAKWIQEASGSDE
jgi:hypothetical protein